MTPRLRCRDCGYVLIEGQPRCPECGGAGGAMRIIDAGSPSDLRWHRGWPGIAVLALVALSTGAFAIAALRSGRVLALPCA